MEKINSRALKAAARESLQRASYSPRKLVLLFAGVSLGLGLVVSLLQYGIDFGIGDTGGLGGIGTRSMLTTLQSMLQLVTTVLAPFWTFAFLRVCLRLGRRQEVAPGSMLRGFQTFGPVLRLTILKGIVALIVSFLAMQIASTLFMLTPAAKALEEVAQQMVDTGVTDISIYLTDEKMLELVLIMAPFLLGTMALLLIPVLYRLRFVDYVLMDLPQKRAMVAMRFSLSMTHKRCLEIFKVDVSFWWYYLLELLAAALAFGDWILLLCGVSIPGNADLVSFLFVVAGSLAQLGLYLWKRAEVETVYALMYDEMLPKAEVE